MTESELETNKNENQVSDNNIFERAVEILPNLNDCHYEEVIKYFISRKEKDMAFVKEYMKSFDFKGMSILDAIRLFTSKVLVAGDSFEMKNALCHFTTRYCDCNHEPFDKISRVTHLILAINTDLHKYEGSQVFDLESYIKVFSDEPPEYNNIDFISNLYKSIKENKLKFSEPIYNTKKRSPNSELDVNGIKKSKNDMINKRHFSEGFVSRKILRTMSGKLFEKSLTWKTFFVSLDNLSLSLYKEDDAKKFFKISNSSHIMIDNNDLQSFMSQYEPVEVLAIFHCISKPVLNCNNKFTIYLADKSKYCFKVGTSSDVQFWVSTINYSAALLSKPREILINLETFLYGPIHYLDGLTKYDIDTQSKKFDAQCKELMKLQKYAEDHKTEVKSYKSTIKDIKSQIERFETYKRHLDIANNMPPHIICGDIHNLDNEIDNSSTYSSTNYNSDMSSKISVTPEYCIIEPDLSSVIVTEPFKTPLVIESLSKKSEIGEQGYNDLRN